MKHVKPCLILLFPLLFFIQTAEALQVDPASHDFGTLATGEVGSREFRLSNREENDVRLLAISLAGDPSFRISQNTCDEVLREKENCRVRVEFAPLASGLRTADLTIVTDDVRQPQIGVPLQGTGETVAAPPPTDPPSEPPTEPTDPPTNPADPPADQPLTGIQIRDSVEPFFDRDIPFRDAPVGLAKRRFIQLVNRNAQEIEVLSVTRPNAPFSIENDRCTLAKLPYLYSCSIEVVFTPPATGESSGTLVVNTTSVDEPAIQVALSGNGIAETSDFPAPILIHPENGQPDMKDSVLFRWSNCRDATGKVASYRVHVGKQTPLPEAPARRVTTNFVNMGFGLGGLWILWRRKKGWLLPVLVAATLFASCSDDVEDSSLATVSDLEGNTTYYWQVVAEYDDGIENRSAVQTFSTR